MFSVYGLVDPRTEQVCYVGMTEDVHKRYAQHLLYPHKHEAKSEWLADLRDYGLLPTLIILESGLDEVKGRERENYWIAYYLEQGIPLTNRVVPAFLRKQSRVSAQKEEPTSSVGKAKLTYPSQEGELASNMDAKVGKSRLREHTVVETVLSDKDTYYTPPEIAARLQISNGIIMRELRSGVLQGTKFRRQWRISKTALEQYLSRKMDPKSRDLLAVS